MGQRKIKCIFGDLNKVINANDCQRNVFIELGVLRIANLTEKLFKVVWLKEKCLTLLFFSLMSSHVHG